MVWVVETGMPRRGREEQRDRAAGLGAEAADGFSLVIFMPIVFTMRQPPNSVPRPIAAWQREHDPQRDMAVGAVECPAAMSSTR